MSDGGERLSVGQIIDRAIALLEKAEALRLEAQRKAQNAVACGQLARLKEDPSSILGSAEELSRLKLRFDRLAGPLVQVAYALNIDAAPLDDFIRTGNPTLVPGAVRVLRLIQGEALRRSVPGLTDGPQAGQEEDTAASAKWQEVQGKLLVMRENGEPYTTLDDLAARVGCGRTTLHKAITKSAKLTGWQARHPRASPKAQSLNPVVMDNAQIKVDDPAEIAAENERLDNEFARLIQDATPEERAKWNGYDTEKKREFARTRLEQEEDRAVEESGPQRTDPAYNNPKRRGNRLLGRKP
jgi:hypothetical protein